MAQIYNRLCSCYRVYYVNVPQNFTVYNLQRAIAAELRVELPLQEGSEARRAARIHKVLDSQKEYVVILDGLSQHFCLEDVGIILRYGNGQKVILRYSESLFMEKLDRVNVTALSEEVVNVAGKIVTRCESIPSRIITMAVQLRGVSDINEWRNTLNEM